MRDRIIAEVLVTLKALALTLLFLAVLWLTVLLMAKGCVELVQLIPSTPPEETVS